VHEAAGQNYRFSSLVLGVVKSAPFTLKIKKAPVNETAALAGVP
jgi:hypothetical protein